MGYIEKLQPKEKLYYSKKNIYFSEQALENDLLIALIRNTPLEEVKKNQDLLYLLEYSNITNYRYLYYKVYIKFSEYMSRINDYSCYNIELIEQYENYFKNLRSN